MAEKIRVVVVDDSAFMRKLLTQLIESDPECKVIKTARDGVAALKAVGELRPDVVTLDIELPEIDGFACLAYIMDEFPTPVVMVSGFSRYLGEETIKCLEYGAVDFVNKSGGSLSRSMEDLREELVSKVKAASRVDVGNLKPTVVDEHRKQVGKPMPVGTDKIVAIASSTGGPRALSEVIPNLPADLTAGVLVVQHMPRDFIPAFAKRLNSVSALMVKVAEDSEPIQSGKVLIAPGGCHVTVESDGNTGEVIRSVPCSEEEKILLCPVADEPMISLAPIYGRNATGVVLTGMGNDGTRGLQAIKRYGGRTIAEDESTAVIYGMPRAAVVARAVHKTAPLGKIADEIAEAVKSGVNV